MTERQLQDFLPFLCRQRIGRTSAVRQDALARMYLAVAAWIDLTGQTDEAVRRRIALRLQTLYGIADRETIGGLTGMYRLTGEASAAQCRDRDAECSRLYRRLIGAFAAHPAADGEEDALRCIVYELGRFRQIEPQMDYYPFFRKTCQRWVGELGPDGCWTGLPAARAFRRIALLQDNRRVFGDDRFDDAARNAYGHYRARTIVADRATDATLDPLCALYELRRLPGSLPPEPDTCGLIARRLEEFAAEAVPRSDAWYAAMSVAVAQGCREAIDRLMREIFSAAG